MSQTTFLLATLASVLSSALYLHVGNVLRRRTVSADAQLANRMFVLWWLCLGGLGFFGVFTNFAYLAGVLPVWLYQASNAGVVLVLFLALWGLQFYLVYLYTGSRRSFAPLGVFYGLLYFATMALLAYIGTPESLSDDGWTIQSEPEIEFGLAFNLSFTALIVGPQMFAAVAYARLYRKTSDRTQRYRIAMVTAAILVWFGSSIVAALIDASESVAWKILSRGIAVLAALAILFAYRPPTFLQRRLGVQAVEIQSRAAEPVTAPPQL